MQDKLDFSDVGEDIKPIYDVVIVRGGGTEEKITHNGTTYECVSDVSLNEGTGGTRLSLYATRESSFTIDGKQIGLAPISGMCVCSHDAVPGMGDLTNKYGNWEDLLDTDGQIVNLNDGVISTDEKGHIKDCRLFLFVHRFNASIKPGAQIDRGYLPGHENEIVTAFDEEFVGDLYLAG